MIYSKERPCWSDGVWHCPFSKEWVKKMAQAARHCMCFLEYEHVCDEEFLSEPQDARGLPLSWCDNEERRYRNHPNCCTVIYDYDSVPEVVVTNGEDDWGYVQRERMMTA